MSAGRDGVKGRRAPGRMYIPRLAQCYVGDAILVTKAEL